MLHHHSRSAYTLVEILVATAVALILLLSIMRMFGGIGESLNRSQAEMNLALELRRVEAVLQSDLNNRTITNVTTEVNSASRGDGYFSYQEGPMWTPSENEPRLQTIAALPSYPRDAVSLRDEIIAEYPLATGTDPPTTGDWCSLNMAANPDISATEPDSTVGDLDDQLAFTVQVPEYGVPYRGRGFDATDGLGIVESNQAEIAWFVRGTTLYRRVLLIDDQAKKKSIDAVAAIPPLDPKLKDNRTNIDLTSTILNDIWTTGEYAASTPPLSFYDIFDISVRNTSGNLTPNKLDHLADRRNRFGCDRDENAPYPPFYKYPTTLGDQCLPGSSLDPTSVTIIPPATLPPHDYWNFEDINRPLSLQASPLPKNDPPQPGDRTQPRRGEDSILKHVLSFDVKAWIDNDPAISNHYFADLGWRGTQSADASHKDFSTAGRYANATTPMSCVYDTWWDTTAAGGEEPPYGTKDDTAPAELRAIQITIRAYEPRFNTLQEIRLVKRLGD